MVISKHKLNIISFILKVINMILLTKEGSSTLFSFRIPITMVGMEKPEYVFHSVKGPVTPLFGFPIQFCLSR